MFMLHGKELLQMNPYTAQNETKSQRTQRSSSTGKMPGILIQSQTNNKNQDTISFKTTLKNKSYSGSKSNTVPDNSKFVFGSSSPICSKNDCKQEMIDAFYSSFGPDFIKCRWN
jgi:hypothetical protein